MEHFNAYVRELLTLEIKERISYRTKSGLYTAKDDIPKHENIEKEFHGLDVCQHGTNYSHKLAVLAAYAINEGLAYQEYQKQGFINRIDGIRESFDLFLERGFDDITSDNGAAKKYSDAKFVARLEQVFLTPSIKQNSIDPLFRSTLEGVIRDKINSARNYVGGIGATLFSKPADKYSEIEIIDLAEWSLRFIKKKFKGQLEIKLAHPENVQPGQTYGRQDMTEIRVINTFHISTDLPVFDFPLFKNAVRSLLLKAQNKDELATILAQCKRYADENIELYNSYITYLEKLTLKGKLQESDPPKELLDIPVIQQTENIIIDENRRAAIVTRYGMKRFERLGVEMFRNYDFAIFSENVYNFLLSEVYKDNNSANAKKITKAEFENFVDLFYNSYHIPAAIDILKNLSPPPIDKNGNYIGKNKSVITLWITKLKEFSIVRPASEQVYANLLMQQFPNFTVDASTLRKISAKAREDFENDIKVMISAISQSGKLGN